MPDVSYARSDGFHIAYEVLGEPGGVDIVMVSGALFPMEVFPEDRLAGRLIDGLADLGRLVLFDRRGIGMSDPYTDWDRPAVDQWSDDLIAVIEAAELTDPLVFAWDQWGVARAATGKRPDLVSKLVLFNPISALEPDRASLAAERMLENVEMPESDRLIERLALPSRIDDPVFLAWLRRAGRLGASPATAARLWKQMFVTDVETPPGIHVPTLVIHRTDSMLDEYIAEAVAHAIPGAHFLRMPGRDLFPIAGDVDAVVAEIALFATGEIHVPAPDRVVAAVLFTDLVGSTERASEIGDERWRSLLDRHDSTTRAVVLKHGGRVVKYTGDGVLALLPSATGALETANVIQAELGPEGLPVRAGVHVGEVDERGEDVSGLAVNIAARVVDEARPGEVLVSESVRLATAGSGFDYLPMGEFELRGLSGRWILHRWTPPEPPPRITVPPVA